MFKVKKNNWRHGIDSGKIVADFATMEDAINYLISKGCKNIEWNDGDLAAYAKDPEDEKWGHYMVYDYKKLLKIWKQNGKNERLTALV